MEHNEKKNKIVSQKISSFYDGVAKNRKNGLKKDQLFTEKISKPKELILPKSRILELGCGTGNLLKSLETSYGVGVDLSKEIIKEANKDNKGIRFIQGDISNRKIFS